MQPLPHGGVHGDGCAAEWWQLLHEGRLRFQRCDSCGTTQHPPGPLCRRCHRTDALAWASHSGRGSLISATKCLRPTLVDEPYWLAMVRVLPRVQVLALLNLPAGTEPSSNQPGQLTVTEFAGRSVLTFCPDEQHGGER